MTKLIGQAANWIDTTLEEYEREQRERDIRPLTEKADPLALSWAAYHVWEKWPQRRFASWNDLEAYSHDKEMAEATRQYYRNKIGMRLLKSDVEPTEFERALYDICTGGIMRECHRGMIYRLPYFYVEDHKRAVLKEQTKQKPADHMGIIEKSTRRLIQHDRIFHSRRSREIMEYWFHDNETGYAVKWPVDYRNSLLSLVDHYFRTEKNPQIHARWAVNRSGRDGFCYWTLVEPELRFG